MAAGIPLAIAAAGMGVQAVNESDANRRRKHILSDVLADQNKRKASIANETMAEAKNYDATGRAPQLAEAETAASNDYTKALTAAAAPPMPADARSGKLSSDYTTGLPAAASGAQTRAQRLASLMAKVKSAGDLRINEATRRGGVTENVGSRLTDAQFANQAGGQDAAGVRADPMVNMVGQGMQMYGTVAGASALTNAERMKTIQAMMAARAGAGAVGPYTGGI